MNLVSLVWFLLFCPFLFVFLLRLGNSGGHDACPFCDTKRKRDEMNCEECGFEFWKNSLPHSLGFWREGLFFVSSLWSHGLRVSSTFDNRVGYFPGDVRTYGHRDTHQICSRPH